MERAKIPRWEDLDPETRHELDAEYLRALEHLVGPGLSDEGVRAYLTYRHERPVPAITTYEEGQICKMLRHMRDPDYRSPDPVEKEEHRGWLENLGARRFHFTNAQTYVAVMLVGTIAAFIALLAFVLN